MDRFYEEESLCLYETAATKGVQCVISRQHYKILMKTVPYLFQVLNISNLYQLLMYD